MSLRLLRVPLAVTLALAATACGPASHTRDFESGLDDGRAISDLSQPEMMQLCESAADYFEVHREDAALRHGRCVLQVLGSAVETAAECEAAVGLCLEEPVPPLGADCDGVPTLPGCEALVGDYEDCMVAFVDAQTHASDGLDCSLVGDPELPRILSERSDALTQAPAVCEPILASGCSYMMTTD